MLGKGNMWSAIPVALLYMIVNWNERKQGSGPEGDKVLSNTGDQGHSSICLFVRLSVSPSPRALLDLKSTHSGLKFTL